MNLEIQIACYRLIAELLLHPEDRDRDKIDVLFRALRDAPKKVREPISEFLNDPLALSRSEYVQTLELSPPCPLYLGSYLFDEPTTCRGVGTSGRNAFMLELSGLYGHFGFQMQGGELADYLPILVDFLGISLIICFDSHPLCHSLLCSWCSKWFENIHEEERRTFGGRLTKRNKRNILVLS